MSQAGTLKCCDLAAGQQQRMQLPGTTPPVKKQLWKIRRFSRVANLKIILPLQQRRPLPAAETGRSCWGRILIFQSPAKGLRKNQQMQLVRPHPKGGVSNQPSGLLLSARFPTGRNVYQQAVLCPENRKKLLRVRPGGFEQGAISDNFRRSRLLRGCGGRNRGWVQGRADRPDTW